MSGWNQFPNWTEGPPYVYFSTGDEIFITHNSIGILRPGADAAILAHKDCAKQFLTLLEAGALDLRCQQRIASLLLEISRKCQDVVWSSWQELIPTLEGALQSIAARAGEMMIGSGGEIQLDEDDLADHFGYGPRDCTTYGIYVARCAAQACFLSELSSKILRMKSPADLCGHWWLEISDPQNDEYASTFAGYYGEGAHARIIEHEPGKRWTMAFMDFPAIKNWYQLEGAAYRAAAPLVAKTLGATVVAVGELVD